MSGVVTDQEVACRRTRHVTVAADNPGSSRSWSRNRNRAGRPLEKRQGANKDRASVQCCAVPWSTPSIPSIPRHLGAHGHVCMCLCMCTELHRIRVSIVPAVAYACVSVCRLMFCIHHSKKYTLQYTCRAQLPWYLSTQAGRCVLHTTGAMARRRCQRLTGVRSTSGS